MLNVLKANEEYENNIKRYTKKDGILALGLFGIIIAVYSVLGVLENHFVLIKENIRIFGCLVNLLMIFITILFVKLNKQKIYTIGFLKGKWKMSIVIGVVLAAFYFYNNCLSHVIEGDKFVPLEKFPILVIYFLLVAVCEEFVFRGYIGTRIRGLLKNKYIAVCLTGIMFVIMHFPYRMIAYGMSLSDLTINNMGWILDLFIFNIMLSFIYMKTNSLYGAIIPHWISNLACNIIIS